MASKKDNEVSKLTSNVKKVGIKEKSRKGFSIENSTGL